MLLSIPDIFKGRFLADVKSLQEKLFQVKAFVFDWDGVFNNGSKDGSGGSTFSEIDAMGTNLLRFNHYLRRAAVPLSVIITGEHNLPAFAFAQREHFDTVYFKTPHKQQALRHLCAAHGLQPAEIAFVFDDVLDLPIAAEAGLRLMVARKANPLLLDFAADKGWADYITHCSGNSHAVREAAELLLALSGQYHATIQHRIDFSEMYTQYLQARNQQKTQFYTTQTHTGLIIQQEAPQKSL
jgi:3-deoxy-D-manno-octulosonate 8-phosphate phosphatase (KDO 8-P phosphatase)